MEHTDNDFFNDVAKLADKIKCLADDAFPVYKTFTDDVISDCITDIAIIEQNLDYMLSYCFDDRILSLYKKILRKFYKQYPDLVKFYVDAYYYMYEEHNGG